MVITALTRHGTETVFLALFNKISNSRSWYKLHFYVFILRKWCTYLNRLTVIWNMGPGSTKLRFVLRQWQHRGWSNYVRCCVNFRPSAHHLRVPAWGRAWRRCWWYGLLWFFPLFTSYRTSLFLCGSISLILIQTSFRPDVKLSIINISVIKFS